MFSRIFKILYGLLFILVPLAMAPFTSELFEFNKIIVIYIIATLVLTAWILEMILKNKIMFKRTPLDIPVLIFLVSQIASTIFSIDIQTSLFGYYGRFNGGLISIITYLVLYYGYVAHFTNEETVKFIKISLITSFLVILWAIPGKFGYDLSCLLFTGKLNSLCWTSQFRPAERIFSTLGQPNWLGTYLAVNFSLGLFFLSLIKRQVTNQGNALSRFLKKNCELIILFYLILNFVSIQFTKSRSSLLAVLIVIFIYFLYLVKRRTFIEIKLKKYLILVSVLLLSLLTFGTGVEKIDSKLRFPRGTNTEKVKVQTTKLESAVTESLDIRKIVWQGAVELTKRYPLFGTGLETFAYSYYFVRPKIHNSTSEWDYLYNKAHNEYLNYSATTGLIGIVSYLIMIFAFLWLSARKVILKAGEKDNIDSLNIAIVLAYLAILVTNFFGFSTTVTNVFFYILPAMIIATKANSMDLTSVKLDSSRIFLSVLTILSSAAVLFYLTRYYLADYFYAKSEAASQQEEYEYAAYYLDTALKLKNEHVYQDKYSYALAQLALVTAYDNKNEKISKTLLKLSQEYNQRSIKQAPFNMLYYKTKAKNDYLYYQIDFDSSYIKDALSSLNKAAELAPTDPKIPYSTALFYAVLEDETNDLDEKKKLRAQSIRSIDKTIDLKANYRDAYLLKAQLLKKYGYTDEARSSLLYILKFIEPNDLEAKKALEEL